MPRLRLQVLLAATIGVLSLISTARAQSVTALTSTNTLVTFNAATPGTINSTSPVVSGLVAGDSLSAIDYRPADSQLIGFGYNSTTGAAHVYSISLATGVATSINANTLTLSTGVAKPLADFNPFANALRVTTSAATANNLRIPTGGTGALTPDTDLNPANAGILGSAYSRNQPGGGTSGATTLYLVSGTTLYSQGTVDFFTGNGTSPNTGTLNTIATLTGVSGTIVGFDIAYNAATAGTAYLATGNTFYGLNLATGAANTVGTIGGGLTIRDFAALPVPEPGTWALCAVGAVICAVAFRRRRVA